MFFSKSPEFRLTIPELACQQDDTRTGNGREKHYLFDVLLVLYVSVLVFFGRRKVEAIPICNKEEPFLVDVNLLHHIAVCSIFLNENADPCNPQKLVFVSENELKVAAKFLQKSLLHNSLNSPN